MSTDEEHTVQETGPKCWILDCFVTNWLWSLEKKVTLTSLDITFLSYLGNAMTFSSFIDLQNYETLNFIDSL